MALSDNQRRKSALNNQVLPGAPSSSDSAFYAAPELYVSGGGGTDAFTRLANAVQADLPGFDLTKISFTDQQNLDQYFKNLASAFFDTQRRNAITDASKETFFNPGTEPFIFSFQNFKKSYPGPAKFYTGSGNNSNITGQRWVLPVPPEGYSVTVPGSQNVINSISGQSYTHAGNIELDEISFSGFFPYLAEGGESTNNTSVGRWPDYIPQYVKTFGYHSPSAWVQELVTAFRANQPLLFSISASSERAGSLVSGEGIIIEPTTVSVSAFDWKMGADLGGDRRDVEFNITLKRWKEQKLSINNFNISGSSVGGRRAAIPDKRIHVVNPGESLVSIAQQDLGDGTRWREIWNLNKRKIGNRGNVLRVGMRLRMPRSE